MLEVILSGGAVAQLGARLDGIEEVVGSNPIGSTKNTQTNLLTERHCWRCMVSIVASTPCHTLSYVTPLENSS